MHSSVSVGGARFLLAVAIILRASASAFLPTATGVFAGGVLPRARPSLRMASTAAAVQMTGVDNEKVVVRNVDGEVKTSNEKS